MYTVFIKYRVLRSNKVSFQMKVSDHYRILVIDDDELVSEYLAALLESESYEVKVLNRSIEALECFTEHPDDFDLVITDQVMPEMTGVEIAQAMMKVRPDTPILLITGYSEKITAENAKSFGLRGYFPKPINEEQLLSKISSLMSDLVGNSVQNQSLSTANSFH